MDEKNLVHSPFNIEKTILSPHKKFWEWEAFKMVNQTLYERLGGYDSLAAVAGRQVEHGPQHQQVAALLGGQVRAGQFAIQRLHGVDRPLGVARHGERRAALAALSIEIARHRIPIAVDGHAGLRRQRAYRHRRR